MKIAKYLTLIGIVIILFLCVVPNKYLKSRDRRCEVIGKMVQGGGRYSDNNILILRELEQNVIFDLHVSPSTYYLAQPRQILTFNLRQMDINQTPRNNTIYFFGFAFLLAIGCICIFVGIGIMIFDKNNLSV